MESLLTALGRFISRQWVLVVAVALILMVAAIFGARNVTMAIGARTVLPPQSEVYQNYERHGDNFGSDPLVVLVTAEKAQQLVLNLPALDLLETTLSQHKNILSAAGPAFAIRQILAQQTGNPSIPTDSGQLQALALDASTGQVRPQFDRLFPQGKYAMVRVTPKGNLEQEDLKAVVDDVRKEAEAAGFSRDVVVKVTGLPAVSTEMESMMRTSMRNMILLASLLMLLVLAMIFNVRGLFFRRWLSLGVVLVGIVYTFGAMGVLGVPMTMVSMAVFPILIGLGVDYGVQFHNRYDEEVQKGKASADAVALALRRMAPAVGLAVFATALGFGALFFSPVAMIRDFGRMLLIGVGLCYLTAMLFLLSVLHWMDRRLAVNKTRAATTATDPPSWLERGLKRLAAAVIHRPLVIIPVALLLTATGFVADTRVATEADELKFISQDTAAIRDLMSLQNLVGGVMTANVMIEAQDVTDPSVMRWMLELQQLAVQKYGDTVASAWGLSDLVLQATGGKMPEDGAQVRTLLEKMPSQVKASVVNEDYTIADVTLTLRYADIERLQSFREGMESELKQRPEGVGAALTGRAVMTVELFHALTSGRMEMTLAGAGLILGGLLLVFRRKWLRAVLAVLPIGLIVGWSGGTMYLLGIKYTPLTATLGALIIGIGTEFTILLMMRYYEERGRGEAPFEAMSTAMTRIGRAILASGVAVIAGFASLLASSQFPIVRDFGVVTMIVVAFALLSTLVVLPPLIVWVDSWRERRHLASKTA